MNAHAKTILTIAVIIAVIAIMCRWPFLAWWAWGACWVVIFLVIVICVYGMIYCAYADAAKKPAPPQNAMDAFDPII